MEGIKVIQGKDICKKFGDFQALDRASFHVPKGAVYGLVGPKRSRKVYDTAPCDGNIPAGQRRASY